MKPDSSVQKFLSAIAAGVAVASSIAHRGRLDVLQEMIHTNKPIAERIILRRWIEDAQVIHDGGTVTRERFESMVDEIIAAFEGGTDADAAH
jgi:hypothetical protein